MVYLWVCYHCDSNFEGPSDHGGEPPCPQCFTAVDVEVVELIDV